MLAIVAVTETLGGITALIAAILGAGGAGALLQWWIQFRRQKGKDARAWRKDEFEHLTVILENQGARIAQLEKENSTYLETIARLQLEIGTLREAVRRLEGAATSATAVVEADSNGNITAWNAGAQSMFHYELKEVIGKPITVLIPERYLAAHSEAFAQAVADKRTPLEGKLYDFSALTRGGTEIPVRLKLGGWERRGRMFFTAEISRR